MRRIFLVSLAVLVLGISAFAENTLDKMSINVYMRAQRAEAEWRWTPKIDFKMWGGLSSQVGFEVEYTLPTGKPFVKISCLHNGRSDDTYVEVQDCGNDLESNVATNQTGVFGLKIRMIDELNSINKEIYSGKFTVNKYLYNPAKQPQFAKNFYYYVDYDWRLTTAYIGRWKDEYTPYQIFTWVWIKKDQSSPEAKAYLIFNGKTIGESSYGADLNYGTEENDDVEFTRLRFAFNATFSEPESPSYSNWWRLDKNPGDYEIKVLRKGELARVIKFSIGADGKPVQNNIGKEIKEGYSGIIAPVQLVGNSDGTLNPTVLKSGWWGNPISGITQ